MCSLVETVQELYKPTQFKGINLPAECQVERKLECLAGPLMPLILLLSCSALLNTLIFPSPQDLKDNYSFCQGGLCWSQFLQRLLKKAHLACISLSNHWSWNRTNMPEETGAAGYQPHLPTVPESPLGYEPLGPSYNTGSFFSHGSFPSKTCEVLSYHRTSVITIPAQQEEFSNA